MRTSNITLLPFTADGTPSGNYDGSSAEFSGDSGKAASYYSNRGDLQTVAFYLTGFVGTITIQGTLESNSTTDTWFDLYTIGDGSSAVTSNTSTNISGNFTWIRASVSDFSAGTIDKVVLSY